MDGRKPEASLLTITVYPADVWPSMAAAGGPPVGQVLARTDRWAYLWSGRQDAPYGDGSPDEQTATALYADVSSITNAFRLLASAAAASHCLRPQRGTRLVRNPIQMQRHPLDSRDGISHSTRTGWTGGPPPSPWPYTPAAGGPVRRHGGR
jgi:hypothetical protein